MPNTTSSSPASPAWTPLGSSAMWLPRSARLTVPVDAYVNARASRNRTDATRLMTTYVMPERTCSRRPPSVMRT